MPWSDTWANNVLTLAVGGGAVSPPANRYLALLTSAPNADGTGGTEVAAGDYARINASGKLGASASRKITNTASFDFSGSAASAWGTLGWFKLMDASSGGACIRYGTINPSLVIGIASTVSIAIGQLTFEELTT